MSAFQIHFEHNPSGIRCIKWWMTTYWFIKFDRVFDEAWVRLRWWKFIRNHHLWESVNFSVKIKLIFITICIILLNSILFWFGFSTQCMLSTNECVRIVNQLFHETHRNEYSLNENCVSQVEKYQTKCYSIFKGKIFHAHNKWVRIKSAK